MRKQYNLTLNCTQAETEYRLKQQLRVFSPVGIVEDNHFKIYKRSTGIIQSHGILRSYFCFYGEYQQIGKHTAVTYQVRPYYANMIAELILGFGFLSMIITAIATRKSILLTFLSCVGFLLFFYLITQLEKENCIADFEKRLTMEMSWKK